MNPTPPHSFAIGDRVRAVRRTGFPVGTVLGLLDKDYVLVRWDGDTLETAHHEDLASAAEGS